MVARDRIEQSNHRGLRLELGRERWWSRLVRLRWLSRLSIELILRLYDLEISAWHRASA